MSTDTGSLAWSALDLEHAAKALAAEIATADIGTLTQCGYSADEIVSLLWLRQRYQSGGSDRAAVARYLEFLRHLVMSGRLEA